MEQHTLNIFVNIFQFSSFYFRNVTFSKIPNNLQFEEKVEVLFSGVTVTDALTPPFQIIAANRYPGKGGAIIAKH